MKSLNVALLDSPSLSEEKKQWWAQHNIPLLQGKMDERSQLWLVTENDQLRLYCGQGRSQFFVSVNFQSGSLKHRQQYGITKNQLFAKALGLKYSPQKVLDLTAGFGKDSFVMACFGLEVLAIESHPVVYALLENGWDRALKDKEFRSSFENRLQFKGAEAKEELSKMVHGDFDVIFYDPMFPEKKKSALAPKEMQALQSLIPSVNEGTEAEILDLAQKVARQRVVVKRPLKAPHIGKKPDYDFKGKTVRYDMYLCYKYEEV